MSYTDYLKRMVINTPKVIDTQMRFPDASAFTNRVRLAATSVNRRSDHVINNVMDPSGAPNLHTKQVMNYSGRAYGGRNQDASSWTQSLGARALGQDTFLAPGGTRRIQTVPVNSLSGRCVTGPPASQVVSQYGNFDNQTVGLNMGYTALNGQPNQVGVCVQRFYPLTKSQFVDTIPDIKLHKVGSAPQPVGTQTRGGRQVVQNPISCTTTNTSGDTKSAVADANLVGLVGPKIIVPFNSYSEPPHNPEKARFVTSPTGPQVGGGYLNGSRAPKTGGAAPMVKRAVTHRGWATPSRNPYPHPRVPPRGSPAQLKINDPNHYKI
jgi:hypothetical protein